MPTRRIKTISIVINFILLIGTIAVADYCYSQEQEEAMPYYFIAIHNEPYHSFGGRKMLEREYLVLKQMIEEAGKYNIKLTLMFTPQWADYISE